MVELDYFIMYSAEGIPIYSYKFNQDFQISDDFLLSAFLTSLNQYAMSETSTNRPDTMLLDEQEIKISYSAELKLSTIEIDKTILIFYHGEGSNLTIGVGINQEHYGAINTLFSVTQMMVELDEFMMDFTTLDWRDVELSVLRDFENELHTQVIHKYMETHTSDDECYLGDLCPYREGLPPRSKSIGERLRMRFGRDKPN